MALNLATLKTRSLTAVIFVVVMLGGLLWSHWSFFWLFTIIHFGCWSEYQKLIGKIDPEYTTITPFHKYSVRIAGWCIMLYFTNNAFNIGDFSLHAVGWWVGLICVFMLPIIELLFAGNIRLKNIWLSALGLLYISLSWGLMIDLRAYGIVEMGPGHLDEGYILPCGLIFSIWINDTMAYIVGSLIGKTPFSAISPKKTWEGTIGGAILCVVVIALLGWWMDIFRVVDWIAIAAIAAIAGTAGDLLESKLKRMANVKDSGTLMPGHGGFLDRFDSLLIATPFVWLYVNIFMK
ncbi:phosphatidate cytidylyltransferase [Paraflavitalea soli]|uniref:Phosphatidate cytidylyltransferase n=1 Tax=Paraflavitalea soli TaxID=2315862 RepID=A0A3B7MPK8_9BACT|nr:phosphatidate cytidylyltransferase [Paraflavitalea soli]AXY76432.1 phosphatidate cytidylyltransferase [Paraflavitalea soli]